MTLNASISKNGPGQYAVQVFKEYRCPACDRLLLQMDGEPDETIQCFCNRCKATWRITKGQFFLLKKPKKLSGKLLDNWEKFSRENITTL